MEELYGNVAEAQKAWIFVAALGAAAALAVWRGALGLAAALSISALYLGAIAVEQTKAASLAERGLVTATVRGDVIDFAGAVVGVGPGCSKCLVIESRDDGRRLAVTLKKERSLIVTGDQIVLSTVSEPEKESSFPAVCRGDDCWLVEWTGAENSAVCGVSSANICQEGNDVKKALGPWLMQKEG